MAPHLVVWLQIDPEEAWQRAAASDRPLARDHDGFVALMPEREPLYEGLADAVVPSGDREELRQALASILALRDLPAGTRMLWTPSLTGSYPPFIGEGPLRTRLLPLVSRRLPLSR